MEDRQKQEISLEVYQELFAPLYPHGVINTCFPSIPQRTRACILLKLRYERKRRDKYELHTAKSHNGA